MKISSSQSALRTSAFTLLPRQTLPRLGAIHNRGSNGTMTEGSHIIPIVVEGTKEIMHLGGGGGLASVHEYSSKLLVAI